MARSTLDISAAIAQKDRGYELVDRYLLEIGDSPSAWVVAPLLRALYLQLSPHPVSGRMAGLRKRAERAGNQLYAVTKPSDARYLEVGPALLSFAGDTQSWTLGPIVEWARGQGIEVRELTARQDPRALSRAGKEAVESADAFVDFIVAEGVDAPCPPAWVYRHFLGAARYLAHSEALLSRWGKGPVVVATNHSKAARALIRTANAAGLATVYFPHVAMLRDERFWDLPTHFAAVRGQGEIEVYEGLGVDPEALALVGDPSLDVPPAPELDPEGRIAFGLPPISEQQMAESIATVREAAGDRVIVTPHPDHSPERIRPLLPDTWQIAEVRTFVHLLSGRSPALVQNSSGVAIESLLLGIPTIQLTIEGWAPNYFAIDGEHVPFADGGAELREALAEAREIAAEPDRRTALVDWGRRWCDSGGERAAERGWALIERAAEVGPRRSPAWDGWSAELLGGGR